MRIDISDYRLAISAYSADELRTCIDQHDGDDEKVSVLREQLAWIEGRPARRLARMKREENG